MKSRFIVVLVLIVLLSGCVDKECKTAADCMDMSCFAAKCKDNLCIYSPVSDCCGNEKCEVGETYLGCAADCPNCDDNSECTTDSYDYHKQECVNAAIPNVICCGNSVCEVGETYETCARDCPNCDDSNDCTIDSYDFHEQECVNEAIIPCCGNGLCDEGVETASACPADCPDCNDNNKMTGDSFDYTTQKCEYVIYYFFEDFSGTTSWDLDPRWSIADSVLSKKDDADYAYTSFGEQIWTDYTFRSKVRVEQGVVELSVRSGSVGAYAISVFNNQLILSKDIHPRIDFEVKDYTFAPDTFYEISIELKGNNIKVYVDDKLEIDYTDTNNPLMDGRVALYIGDKAYIDDVIVEESR